MFRNDCSRLCAVLLALFIFCGAAQAVEKNIAVLRIENLDAFMADIDRITSLAQLDFDHKLVLSPLKTFTGLGQLDWLDHSRPLAIVFPTDGMVLGDKAFLSVLPVQDPAAALAAIESDLGAVDPDATGMRVFEDARGSLIAVRALEGYIIIGKNSDLVSRFALQDAFNARNLPQGNLSLDIFLEPIAPLALGGLQSGKQVIEQELKKKQAAEQDAATTEEGAEGQADNPAISTETSMLFVDIYFDLARDILTNVSRLQLAVEISEEEIILHERMVPLAESTLAGMLETQQGGLPELARYIEPGEMQAASIGQISFTPAFTEAVQGYINRYVDAAGQLSEKLGESLPGYGWNELQAQLIAQTADRWTDCFRGDFAGTFGLVAGEGFNMTQISGVQHPEACAEMLNVAAGLIAELPGDQDEEPWLTVEQDALQYRGVSATRQLFRFEFPTELEDAAEVDEFLAGWFGSEGTLSYYGLAGEYMLQTAGPNAEERFKALVDRVSLKQKKQEKLSGLTPELFSPLAIGPGFFVALDLGKIVGEALSLLPVEEDEASGMLEFFEQLTEESARMVFGARFASDALQLDWAAPLKLVESYGRLSAQGQAGPAESKAQEQPVQEHTDGGF